MQVTNVGTHEGTGVVISDQFPAEALGAPTFISSGGLYDSSTGLISWEIPALAVNESVTLTVESVVANPQNANIDGLSESADDEFSNSASVTDDGLNGGDPNPDNNADSVTDQIIAAPDYVIGKTSDTTMVAPTEQISYVITAGNVGTQTGTNVVITDVFPVDILTIVDPAGGTVDASNGTITWNIDEFEVGQTETFTIIAEVLPTANLDTADQLFTNSVSITDDTSNGTDPTPDNNEASESDMLLAGAGEPLFLLALPETVGAPPVSISSTIEFEPGTVREVPNTARILTTDFMKGREEGEEIPTRIGENDILSGGDLLDEYSVRAPEIHCAPHFVSYDYQSDPSNLELLDWLQEPSAEDKQSDNSGNGTDESNEPGESNSDSQAAYDGVKAGVDPAGGTVDASNGTITWNIDEFEVGQTETFTIIAEVLPTANLDTADQLFTNSVSITDDTSNGTDPTPDNNEASESDMLLAGAGEPLFLLALPETVGAPPVSISSTIEFEPGTVREVPNTARILTTDFMKGREEGEEIPTRIGENDILSGGDLLDEYSVRAPEIHCAPHFVSYDYQSDPSNLELLDWLQEPSAEDDQSDDSGNGIDESNEPDDSSSDSQAAYDGVKAGVDSTAENTLHNSEAEPATTSLQQQIQREAKNLYGSGKEELLEAFKDSV